MSRRGRGYRGFRVPPCCPRPAAAFLAESSSSPPLVLRGRMQDLADDPTLLFTQRARLFDPHAVTGFAGILLIVRLELVRAPHRLLVDAMPHREVDRHDNRLVHLVRDDP